MSGEAPHCLPGPIPELVESAPSELIALAEGDAAATDAGALTIFSQLVVTKYMPGCKITVGLGELAAQHPPSRPPSATGVLPVDIATAALRRTLAAITSSPRMHSPPAPPRARAHTTLTPSAFPLPAQAVGGQFGRRSRRTQWRGKSCRYRCPPSCRRAAAS